MNIMSHSFDVVTVSGHPVLAAFVSEMVKELVPRCSFAAFESIDGFSASEVVAKVLIVGGEDHPHETLNQILTLGTLNRVGSCLLHSLPKHYRPLTCVEDSNIVCLSSSASIRELYGSTARLFHDVGLGIAASKGNGAQRNANEFQTNISAGLESKPLTHRQVQIMDLMIQGMSAKEVAKLLGISPETVRGHLKDIFIRLSVKNIAQATEVYGVAKRRSYLLGGV